MMKNWSKPLMTITALAVTATMSGCGSTPADSGEHQLVVTKEALVLTAEPVEPSDSWKLIWSDEFDGDEIDTRKWGWEQNCWGGGNNEQQCYTKRKVNSFVEDGKLHIVAKRGNFTGPDNPDGKKGLNKTLPYTSARLRTLNKGDWKYGRFEVRAKLPEGQGTWPAIWMLPTDWVYGGWAASGEIDIMEAVNLKTSSDEKGSIGQPESRVHGTLHFGKKWPDNAHTGQGAKLPNGINPADDYHTYAIEWEEGEIRWYVDNIHFATQKDNGWYSQYEKDGELITATEPGAPFNQKFHLLLNLAVGGNWAAKANEHGIDESVFPQALSVDYVRVYRCRVDRWKGKGCASVSEDAVLVPGVEPPAILAADDSYADGPLLDIYTDNLNSNLAFESYNPVDAVKYAEVEEAGRGKVIQVTKQDGAGNIYFRAPKTDLTHWLETGHLVLDVKVESQASAAELLVKLDSGWPNTSDYTIELPPVGSWGEVKISIADILAGGNRFAGGAANIAEISNLLVFEQSPNTVIKLDNIRFEK